MGRWILLKHRFWSSRSGVGTLDSFLIGSRGGWCCRCLVHTGRTGVWMTLTLAVGQPSHYGHQYVSGLGPRNQHVLGAIHSGLTWCLVIRDCQRWVIPDLLRGLSYQSQRRKPGEDPLPLSVEASSNAESLLGPGVAKKSREDACCGWREGQDWGRGSTQRVLKVPLQPWGSLSPNSGTENSDELEAACLLTHFLVSQIIQSDLCESQLALFVLCL